MCSSILELLSALARISRVDLLPISTARFLIYLVLSSVPSIEATDFWIPSMKSKKSAEYTSFSNPNLRLSSRTLPNILLGFSVDVTASL